MWILEPLKNQSESLKSPGNLFLKKGMNPVFLLLLFFTANMAVLDKVNGRFLTSSTYPEKTRRIWLYWGVAWKWVTIDIEKLQMCLNYFNLMYFWFNFLVFFKMFLILSSWDASVEGGMKPLGAASLVFREHFLQVIKDT